VMSLRFKVTSLLVVTTIFLMCFVSSCGGVRWKLRMSFAEGALRKVERAENEYKARNGRYGSMRELSDAGLINGSLAKGVGDGYRYEIRLKDDSYQAHALPDKSVDHKLPAYLIDETGVMHVSELEASEATVNDPSPSEK